MQPPKSTNLTCCHCKGNNPEKKVEGKKVGKLKTLRVAVPVAIMSILGTGESKAAPSAATSTSPELPMTGQTMGISEEMGNLTDTIDFST
jgi:hypothetical protein